ncbi:MAG: GH116 family glycosyl hydrolase [Candidatus Eremiobacterota bacterium]
MIRRLLLLWCLLGIPAMAQVPRFPLEESGLELSRPTRNGTFLDVCGRRAALFGYEGRKLEVWVYPMKILEDFELSIELEGYPTPIPATSLQKHIAVRPEATILTCSHTAFTLRQIMFSPQDEPGIVILLDVDTLLPMRITGEFRPRLKLMWPAGVQTGWINFAGDRYMVGEDSGRFAGVIGCPGARDVSVMPYQEEPRDLPARFLLDVPVERAEREFFPIVVTGSVKGAKEAEAAYRRILASLPQLYGKTVEHYRNLRRNTVGLHTPDEELNRAYEWSKVGIDRGLVANPLLGTGLVAGFRTSGDSERPGYAWFFGRDALWTVLATNGYGEYATTRTALEFLRKFQREDGKIPHEISQSATLVDWWEGYPFGWASSDATPLYVIAQADLYRQTGDREFLDRAWESILKAWRFTAATDADGDGLMENTGVGHAWVEGGALYPPDQELYLQGCWIEACRSLAELASARGDEGLAREATARAESCRKALEATYWLPSRGFYAYSKDRPHPPRKAEPGPNLARRQARLNELARGGLVDEDTVLPAVPLWWGLLEPERAQSQVDHLGGRALATDWGQRILSDRSGLYDPLSYHYGSVWPLFTGWASMGAYRYGRAHVGYQAVMANVHLTTSGALGFVTELLSGDFLSAFGRSSHHQVWSQAMVAAPILRGMLGLEVLRGGREIRYSPQVPGKWRRVRLDRVAGRIALEYRRSDGQRVVSWEGAAGETLRFSVWLPPDAELLGVEGGTATRTPLGDGVRCEVTVEKAPAQGRLVFRVREGTEVWALHAPPRVSDRSQGLRLLRAVPSAAGLRLVMEGRAGQRYRIGLSSPRRFAPTSTAEVEVRTRGGFVEAAFAPQPNPEASLHADVTLPAVP